MLSTTKEVCICIRFSPNANVVDHEFSIFFKKHKVIVGSPTDSDIMVTNLPPLEISKNSELASFRGVVIVFIDEPDRAVENDYQDAFKSAVILKFRYKVKPTDQDILRACDAEAVKHLVRNGRFTGSVHLFSKYTRVELVRELSKLSLLLVPFSIMIGYLIAKYFVNKYGGDFSFLCWFVYYEPDCRTNIARELQLFALLYAVLNLQFYYSYVLSVLEQIKNEVYHRNRIKRSIDSSLKFIMPILVFVSALIILKALFVFMYSTRIAEDNLFINIGRIFDTRLPFLKDNLLIYYFFGIDLCLWVIAKNFLSVKMSRLSKFMSQRQCNLVDDARHSFLQSLVVDIVVIGLSLTLIPFVFDTLQSQIAAQLIFIQCAYLMLNLLTAVHTITYK